MHKQQKSGYKLFGTHTVYGQASIRSNICVIRIILRRTGYGPRHSV